MNSKLGDFESNYLKIIQFAEKAKERHCEMVLYPEACLFGYHPMDLLKRQSVVQAQIKYIEKLKKALPKNIGVVFGGFTMNPKDQGKPYFNSALVIYNGKIIAQYHKELLPTYDVFDDARHIEPGDVSKNILEFKGKKILITVCEDIWAWPLKAAGGKSFYKSNPIKKIKPGSVDFILNLSASPFYLAKRKKRLEVVRQTAQYVRAPMAYVNMIGGQDELIFDGGSFAVTAKGEVFAQSLYFEEDINVIDMSTCRGGIHSKSGSDLELMRCGLVLGLRDFVNKIGAKQVHLGLSGGVDSALVACLAVDALGPERVKGYALPGPYSSSLSLSLATKLAKNIDIGFEKISINPMYNCTLKSLSKIINKSESSVVRENIQARLRSLALMAVANQKGSLLLNTSNKTEFAAGYGTLYGDMAGGISPIGDLLKRDVYALANHYNSDAEIIPQKILTRPPTAELRPNQKDQDTLPPYNLLDESVVKIVEQGRRPTTAVDQFLLKSLMASEFKRWQSPPILKVRESSFGQGRRMPIAHSGYF